MLTARNINKHYGKLQVLKDVGVDIKKGEIVSISGPSGSGKSTLLHILGTLAEADSGEIFLNDKKVSELKGKQMAAFRNALENACIPGWIAGRKKREVEEQAKKLLVTLGVGERLDNKPGELSGGEQQRVAVARALINNPDIIFADEPSGNLDSANANELHHLFFDLRKKFNQTFLIVTHNEELAQMSDRILHMKDGKIING
jgi:lipoprotein-releasing system ATP-binding protein